MTQTRRKKTSPIHLYACSAKTNEKALGTVSDEITLDTWLEKRFWVGNVQGRRGS